MHYDDRPASDPILVHLHEAIDRVTAHRYRTQEARNRRGDAPLPGKPFVTVTVETEKRTYSGRVFDVYPIENVLTLHDTAVIDPNHATDTAPPVVIRAASIVAVQVQENLNLPPVEFPMTRDALTTHISAFIKQAAAILTDPNEMGEMGDPDAPGNEDAIDDALDRLINQTAPVLVTGEQCRALRAAAQPVNDIVTNSDLYISQWDRFAHATSIAQGLPATMDAHDDDPHLNITVLNKDDIAPGSTTLLKFLTHGIPVNFFFPETHQQALDAYHDDVHAAVAATNARA